LRTNPVHAGPAAADECGEAALAAFHDAPIRPPDEDGGDLRLETAGEHLGEACLVTHEAARHRVQPSHGEPRPLLQESVEPDRLDREDERVLQRHPLVGCRDPEEDPDVADGVARVEDLEDDASAVEVARELDRAPADDPHTGGRIPGPEDSRTRRVVLLAEEPASSSMSSGPRGASSGRPSC
jgi:hypothetical protein